MGSWHHLAIVRQAHRSISEHSVGRAVAAAGIDVAPRFLPVTGSTNADLLAMAAGGAPEWTVVVAGHQEAGRGRLGRTWVEPPGSSLLVSVLLRPDLLPTRAPLLSLAAGLALAGAVSEATGLPARCKWPNDVVVGGRKLAGVLVEAVTGAGGIGHAVVGAGLNLLQDAGDLPSGARMPATSLALEGAAPDGPEVLRRYLSGLRALYGVAGRGLEPAVLPGYRSACDTLGRRVRAGLGGGRVVEGVAEDVGSGGELVVRTPAGPVAVGFGEVEHLD
jgi:BirA family transcriptional regulator, biotin operon repressor / biotin---[acetyl-CoA-carboxylase] ligase